MYGRKYMGIDTSTFLVDKDGVVRGVWHKVKVPGHVAEVLKAVRRSDPCLARSISPPRPARTARGGDPRRRRGRVRTCRRRREAILSTADPRQEVSR